MGRYALAKYLLLACCVHGMGGSVPLALERAVQARAILGNGDLSYQHWRAPKEQPMSHRARFTGDDVILEYRGDPDGMLCGREIDDRPDTESPWLLKQLMVENQTWTYGTSGLLSADVVEEQAPGVGISFRDLGLLPTPNGTIRDFVRESCDFAEEYLAGGLVRVTQVCPDHEVEWTIDTAKGHNPIKVVYRENGEVTSECRAELTEYQGYWYPLRLTFSSVHQEEGKKPAEVFDFSECQFNLPSFPASFTPRDIGVEVGTNVTWHGRNGIDSLLMWTGNTAVSQRDFMNLLRAGEIQYSNRAQKYIKKLKQVSPPDSRRLLKHMRITPEHPTSEWERYTQDFIERFRLDHDQQSTAFRILKSCQEEAAGFLRRNKERIEQLERRRSFLTETTDLKESDFAAVVEGAREINDGIQQIFDTCLVPRLETLPTRGQRANAHSNANMNRN